LRACWGESRPLLAESFTTEGTEDTENGKEEIRVEEPELSVTGLVSAATVFQLGLFPL